MSTLLQNSFLGFVNLDHRKDRLERMQKTLAHAGLAATRVRGMLPGEYGGDPSKVAKMRNRTPGAIGCHFSQVAIMEMAFARFRHAFVMEDDLIICSDFKKRIGMIEDFLVHHPWDIIWLGGTFHINPPYWHTGTLRRDAELTSNPHILRTYGAFCTYAYIVNYESIGKVMRMLDAELPNSIGIDYAMIQMQPRLYTYAFVPGCITQYDNQSDIGKGMTIFSNFSRLGPYWYQDKLENFDPKTFNWHEAKVL